MQQDPYGGCGEPLVLDGQNTTLYSVAFAPDSSARITTALDARAQVWSTQRERLAGLIGHEDRIEGRVQPRRALAPHRLPRRDRSRLGAPSTALIRIAQ
jgi:hypothetical protein